MNLSDPYNTAEFRARALWVAILFAAFFLLLLVRLWYLQIWQGDTYRGFSDRNRFKFVRLSAPRGQLFDRNGVLLADSRPRFDLTYIRGNAQDLDRELQLLQKILGWSDEDLTKRKAKVLASAPYQAQTVAQDITFNQLALVETSNMELSGVDIEVQSVRDYLFHDLFFHSLGYTGEINESELESLQNRFPERNYRLGDQKGIIGIEAIFESLLRGKDGRDFLVVDVKGRRVNQEQWDLLPKAARIEPQAGQSLELSIDSELQKTAEDSFKEQVGAVVALDPRTGEILAYLSRPSLDPNLFTRPISNVDFQKMMNQEHNPFLDRVVGEHYPPGSTFKLIMAVAALEAGVIDLNTSFFCPGSFRFGRRTWSCWAHLGHGRVNVVQAIERSCDVFFYNVALALGLDSMFTWSSRFGLGRRTFIGNEISQGKSDNLIRFNSEVPGFIPSVSWVEEKKQTSVEAETINAGIGQGAYTVTALQLARVVAAIGNGGKIYQPQIILRSKTSEGQSTPYSPVLENEILLKPEVREAVLKGMRNVVEGGFGTAHIAQIPGVAVGGKTGTAQVVSLELSKGATGVQKRKFQDHGLFVALAPLDHPKIAVAVIVENGGHGGTTAAPIAKAIIKNYLDREVVKKEEPPAPTKHLTKDKNATTGQ